MKNRSKGQCRPELQMHNRNLKLVSSFTLSDHGNDEGGWMSNNDDIKFLIVFLIRSPTDRYGMILLSSCCYSNSCSYPAVVVVWANGARLGWNIF